MGQHDLSGSLVLIACRPVPGRCALHDTEILELHMDPILVNDQGSTTLLTIQYNLAAGTLSAFAARRPDLMPLMKKILRFDVNAQYLLTEVAHGLDAPHLETIATLLPNGEFDLHTPNDGACKYVLLVDFTSLSKISNYERYMPPTSPLGGIEKVAIVFARLVVNSEDRGVRPFVVSLTDGAQCCKGVSIQ